MKRTTLAALTLLALQACAGAGSDSGDGQESTSAPDMSAYAPTDAERAQVVVALQSVFDALRAGDADLLRGVMDPSVVMHFSERNAAGELLDGALAVPVSRLTGAYPPTM